MRAPQELGRYLLFEPIASGGMASVHFGRLAGAMGFSRTVAIKRLHPHLATDPDFVSMFLDEAHLAARVQHPNVVAMLDVVSASGEIFLVMEYVEGESLSRLLRAARDAHAPAPLPIVSALLVDALQGLHAAHDARDERGSPLDLVHRDVSPQNVHVGLDGHARMLDFGIAKAASRLQTTNAGEIKGKLAYMAPEQLLRRTVDRRADVYSAAVVAWEMIANRRLFQADDALAVVPAVLAGDVPSLASVRDDVTRELAACVARGLALDPEARYASAADFARALKEAVPPAEPDAVIAWLRKLAGPALDERAARRTEIESSASVDVAKLIEPRSPQERALMAELDTQKGPVADTSAAPVDAPTAIGGTTRAADAPGPRSRGRRDVLVALAALGGGVALSFALFTARAPAPPAPAASTPSPAPILADSVPSASAPLPSSAVSVAVAPSAAATDASRTSSSVEAAPPARRRPPPRRDVCASPTYVDANGIRRIRPECM